MPGAMVWVLPEAPLEEQLEMQPAVLDEARTGGLLKEKLVVQLEAPAVLEVVEFVVRLEAPVEASTAEWPEG